jgi:uncharacterized membrane protein YjfL (UPF0719 family)
MISTPLLAVIEDLHVLGLTALEVTLWVLFGCVLLVGAMKLFDWLTPGKLQEQVFKEGNVAAATVYGAATVGIAIIITSALH